MLFFSNECINIVYPNENYPLVLTLYEKKLDSIQRRSSSCFKDKLWFQTKRRLQMLFSRNQRINIVYPNQNFTFVLSSHEKKLDSIHGWIRPVLKIKFDSKQNEGYKYFFCETNTSISCIQMRTTHLLAPHEKNLDFIHRRSSSCFKDKLWFQTKRRLQMLFSRNYCINIVYPNEN